MNWCTSEKKERLAEEGGTERSVLELSAAFKDFRAVERTGDWMGGSPGLSSTADSLSDSPSPMSSLFLTRVCRKFRA